MTEFDTRAREWDNNPVHWERSQAIAEAILQRVPVHKGMNAMEYGAGTAILSFILSEHFASITLMDQSAEMVKVMEEKVVARGVSQLHPLHFDLEHTDYQENSFDFIFTQMVLHHVNDPGLILRKFFELLKPGGYLAIADLYAEDGSFHGEGFTGHLGFDPAQLQSSLEKAGLGHLSTEKCFTVKKKINDGIREFPVFLMVAQMPQ